MKVKILIVEHDPYDLEFLDRQLSKGEIEVETQIVQTCKEFEDGLLTFRPDLILSDYNLPCFSGKDALQIRRELAPDIPFIFVSGAIGEENAVELIKQGVTDYVLKDKLFALNSKIDRAMIEVKEKKEKQLAEQKIKAQNERLLEIAFLQSHQVRRPVANILGLINMLKTDRPADPANNDLLQHIETAARELDEVIHNIVAQTNSIRNLG